MLRARTAWGDTLGYFSPFIGRASWVDSITVSSKRDVAIWIQRLDSKLNANVARPAIHQLLVGPSYGATAVVPIQSFLNEGEAYTFVLRTAVEQSAAADFSSFCGLHGRHVANDFFMEAPRTMLVIGDSISTTTILGAEACGRNFYHARIAAKLRGEGKAMRRIVKGDGGWKGSHAVTAMERGQLDCGPLNAVMFMLGANDVSFVEFGANLATLIEWKKAFAPKALMIILGPPPRADAAKSETLRSSGMQQP